LSALFVLGLWATIQIYWRYFDGYLSMPLLHLFNFLFLEFYVLFDCGITSYNQLADHFRDGFQIWKIESMYSLLIFLIFVYEYIEVDIVIDFVYLVLFLHIIYCLLKDGISLILPVVLLAFIISLNEERFFFVCIFCPCLSLLAQAFKELPSPYGNDRIYHHKNPQKMILLLTISMTYMAFVQLGGEFNMNVNVRAGGIGVPNVESFPTFSAIMMGYHKLSYFFMLIAILSRMIINDGEKMQECLERSGNSRWNFGEYVWKIMILKSLILMWTFHLAFWLYKDYLTCFIMTMITSLFTLLIGLILLFNQGHEQLFSFAKYVNRWYRNRNSPLLP